MNGRNSAPFVPFWHKVKKPAQKIAPPTSRRRVGTCQFSSLLSIVSTGSIHSSGSYGLTKIPSQNHKNLSSLPTMRKSSLSLFSHLLVRDSNPPLLFLLFFFPEITFPTAPPPPYPPLRRRYHRPVSVPAP